MSEEDDATFVKRIVAEIDGQSHNPDAPNTVELNSADIMRLVKLYAGIPPTAMRVN